jgi:GGDEF domain-containing protein
VRRTLPWLHFEGLESAAVALMASTSSSSRDSLRGTYVSPDGWILTFSVERRLFALCSLERTSEAPGLRFEGEVDAEGARWFELRLRDLDLFFAVAVDPVTGLCQRNLFLALLDRHRLAFDGHCVAFVDIDAFRPLTDRYPMEELHPLVLGLRDCIDSEMPELGLLCRWGRDKLALVANQTEKAVDSALRRASESYTIAIANHPGGAGRTFSWSTAPVHRDEPQHALLDRLERRLRTAKRVPR